MEIRNAREKWLTERSKLGRDLFQRKFSAEIRFELFAGALRLPGRKTAAGRFSVAPQSAISLGDMRSEREHHVIDEKLVDLGRPAQPFQERGADMANNRVVMTDAELAGELTNARRAKLLGDAIERRTGKIEKQGVERLVDHIARIALEIVEIGRARADIRSS